MARQLWLLRHADAEPHGTRQDSERRLTERGERQAHLAGVAIARMGVEFEGLLSSPKVRALRTATVAAEAWSADRSRETLASGEHPRFGQRARLEVHPPLAGGFDAGQALAALAEVESDGRLLVVGHEPDLSSVVGELTGARIDLKKGGLAVVRIDGSPTHPGGELVVLLRPSELALIAAE
ncbi:MAG: SixA phosphatase family protein [Solirubrobacterales bacterium]